MAIIEQSFFKLYDLAERWGKTEDDILHMLESGLMPSYIWHEGYAESLLRRPGTRFYHKGFAQAGREVALKLLLGKEAELFYLTPYSEPFGPDRDLLIPMQQLDDNTLEHMTVPVLVARTDLVVMSEDVKMIEHPPLYVTGNDDRESREMDDLESIIDNEIEDEEQVEEQIEEQVEEKSIPSEESINSEPAIYTIYEADNDSNKEHGNDLPQATDPVCPVTTIESTIKPGEKPLVGMKEIAEYLGVSVSTVKNYRKRSRAFPFRAQGGKIIAWPSELDVWRKKNRKKL